MKDKKLAVQISQTVRKLRLKAGHSQEMLAEACGRHPTYISQVEMAKKAISVETAKLIASVYGLTVGQFFALVDQDSGSNDD